mmetsp:Transcript_52638/g.150709  ORF Transcript_52638/g.150709 Transcript_52638/m.150709 type:complete len:226 (-) Transcript_52638:40-717(-)
MPTTPNADVAWQREELDDSRDPLISNDVLSNVGCESSSSRLQRRPKVWLNVYDINATTRRLSGALMAVNLGAFHVGVEVLGDEWFFAWGDTDFSGVLWNEPKSHQVHIFRESLCMGESTLTEDEVRRVMNEFMDSWLCNSYHPITRNCVTFAEELVGALRVPESFPRWIRGAMDVGKCCCLLPIANCAWRWLKWWNLRQVEPPCPPPEAEFGWRKRLWVCPWGGS